MTTKMEEGVTMGDYNCPYCGWGEQRGHGRSASVEVTIRDGEVACADAEEWEAEVECAECGRLYTVIYPKIGGK